MKKLLLTVVASIFMVGTVQAEDNWTTSQHNYQLKSDTWGLEIRNVDQDDYDHVEFSYNLSDSLVAELRYAENGVTHEIRPKLTHSLISAGPLSLKHRIEYRYFEGNTTDDSWRYRFIAKASLGSAWVKAEPRWTLGGDNTNDMKIDDIKYQAGYDLSLTDVVVFTPFVEYRTAGEEGKWLKEDLFWGTTLQVKF